jgi:hypothetical protein
MSKESDTNFEADSVVTLGEIQTRVTFETIAVVRLVKNLSIFYETLMFVA